MNTPLRLPLRRTLTLVGLLLLAPLTSAQATFTVNSTADPGNGGCDAAECTLREAILAAEATAALDSIHFDIPGAGVHTITVVGSALPMMFQPAVIDGYTQPGASPNTNGPDQGTNAVIRVELVNGGGAAVVHGLRFCFGDKTVRGLAIGGFPNDGIAIECNGAAGHVVEGCFLGTDATGTVARPNGDNGVGIHSSSGNRVGGAAPAARNVLSGNGRFGVVVTSSGSSQVAIGNVIQGNLIGTDASGTVALPNGTRFPGQLGGVGLTPNQGSMANNVIGGPAPAERNVISGNVGAGVMVVGAVDFTGVRVEGNYIGTDVTGTLPLPNTGVGANMSGSAVTVGGSAPGAGNRIAHNGAAGVSMPGLATGVRVLGNAIHDNAGLGIDLGFPDGIPLANDPNDPDIGANLLQNTPEIEAVGSSDAGLAVRYRVDTDPANATYPLRVEFFRADAGGEGEAHLGSDTYAASDYEGCGSAPCLKTVTFVPAAPVADGVAVVATATDEMGNTSEFTADAAIVAAREGDAPERPAAVALVEAFPNPLESRTTLRYNLHAATAVRLAVYDLLGREVAVLVEDERVAGAHEVTLEAEGLSPGIYVVRLQAGASAVSRRVVVAR